MGCEKCKVTNIEQLEVGYSAVVDLCPLHAAAGELLEAAEAQVDEWHSTFRNMERKEPKSLKLARAAIIKAEGRG